MSQQFKEVNCLITGGAGAIGSYFANRISSEKSYTLDIIDDLTSGFKDNLSSVDNINFFQGSVSDHRFMKKFEDKDYDYIFHFAACFANQNSIDHPSKDLQVNIQGTLNTLKLATKQKNLKKYLYFSSSCIYGNSINPMRETDIPNPDTPYAISKLTGEYYTNFYHHFYKLPTNIFRLFNIYGSNEKPGKYRNVIPNLLAKALKNDDLTITGDGNDTRDFTFIDDALHMIRGVTLDSGCNGQTFNVGNGTSTKIIDLVNAIKKTTNSSSKVVFVPARSWDTVSRRLADIEKILPYQTTKTRLEDGLLIAKKFIEGCIDEI